MGIRIANKTKVVNDSDLYVGSEIYKNRGVKKITHYLTPNIKYPTVEEIRRFIVIRHIWSLGDRFYKLSHKHYGSSKYWWVLPWFNQKPLESDSNWLTIRSTMIS